MADSNYVENSQIIKTSDIGDEVLIPVQVARRYNVGSWSDFETKYLLAKNTAPASGIYTPTVSDELYCTVTFPSVWIWTKIDNVVKVDGIGIMTLDALVNAGSAYISLPVEPANNWSDYYQLGGTVNVYGLRTGDLGDMFKLGLTTDPDTPSKRVLLSIGVEPSAAGDEIIFGVSFSYNVNN